ncbi:MAG: TIGR03013 family PEP-CTERM/XrtA system glycosyltransferase [Gammaproteobacteria bacterium]|nr:TIGR03013 family PEP-CTERM/XrtA system glycosyltransferase [Gammaproteobacteria bacterium]
MKIFGHYIPTTLILLGFAELMILVVSTYVGAALILAAHGTFSAAGLPLRAVIFTLAVLSGMLAMGSYQRDQRAAPIETLVRLLLSFAVGLLLFGVACLAWPVLKLGPPVIAIALAFSLIGIATSRLVCAARTDALFSRRVLVLGVGERARQIENLRRASDRTGITLVGFIDIGSDPPVVSESRIIRPNVSLRVLVERFAVEELVVAIDDRRKGLPVAEILECKMHGIRILDEASFLERQLGKIRLDSLHPSGLIFADGYTPAMIRLTEKRLLDIAIATALLVVALPLMLLAAVAVLLESDGPIIYVQERVGLRGKVFRVYKFRSMRQDAEADGQAVWAAEADSRVTRVGNFLRQTRIDELPQLFNVLKGEMSFVGPRPERPGFVEELSRAIAYYELRHHVKPGITGWAQICYPYGSSINDAREKLQYDLYYLKNYSLFLDLTIIFQTIQVIAWGKGAR